MISRRKYLLIALFLGVSISCISQSKKQVYKLKSVTQNADFDYEKLQNFDDVTDVEEAFIPVQKGYFTVYTFIATFKGKRHWVPRVRTYLDSTDNYQVDKDGFTEEDRIEMNKKGTFHDILIVKTNSKNEIIDAYQYTLEWAEPESSYDLFRSTTKKQKLTNGLSIEKLKFYRTQKNHENKPLDEKGIIRLK
jgi:hypothetical protein